MKENSLKVLLIEDDEDDYILTRDLLSEIKGTDYETTWISRYSASLAEICKGDQDVCLIDYRLGEGTGIELVREAIAAGCAVPDCAGFCGAGFDCGTAVCAAHIGAVASTAITRELRVQNRDELTI